MLQWDPKWRPRIQPANTEFCRQGCPFYPPPEPENPQPPEAEKLIQALTRILYALSPLQRDDRITVLLHAAFIADEVPPPKKLPEAA